MDTSEIYTAVASANLGLLRANKSEVGSFVSPAKNTILHIYIISQSKKAKGGQKLLSALKSLPAWFQEKPEAPLTRAETVQELLKEWPELLGKANGDGDTPLHMAARHGHDDIAKALIDHVKVKEKPDVEAGKVGDDESVQSAVWKMLHETNAEKETALHQAVRYGHYKVAQVLVAEDDPSFVYSENEDGETILYMAAERDNMKVLDLILDKYTSPAYQGPHGRTAMHAAVLQPTPFGSFYAYTVMREKKGLELLATKADNEGKTPFHYMSYLFLLFGDKSAISMADNDGNTALHIAASTGDSWSVEMFIKKCPECFEVVDQQGRNALHLAAKSGDKRTVDVILENEFLCDLLKKKDNNGNTPLHLLATSPNIWPGLLKDRRFDRMAINRDKLNPAELLLSSKPSPTLSKRERRIGKWLKDANTYRRRRQTNSDTTNAKEAGEGKEVSRNYSGDSFQDARQSQLVVAALIATVTFAAGFTLPGGYIQEKGAGLGHAVLTKNVAFVVFVISDTIGLVFSCAAVFIHLLIAIDGYNEKKIVRKLFENALPLTLLAIVAMVIAFICGLYSVLSHAPSLAVSTSIIGMVFFYLLGYLCEEARETTQPIFGWVPKTLTQLVNMLFKWVHRKLEFFAYYLVVAGFYILVVPFLPLWGLVSVIRWYQSRKNKNQDALQSASFSEV